VATRFGSKATFIEKKTRFENPIFRPGEPILWAFRAYLSVGGGLWFVYIYYT